MVVSTDTKKAGASERPGPSQISMELPKIAIPFSGILRFLPSLPASQTLHFIGGPSVAFWPVSCHYLRRE
jgi:hypothetical protein